MSTLTFVTGGTFLRNQLGGFLMLIQLGGGIISPLSGTSVALHSEGKIKVSTDGAIPVSWSLLIMLHL